MILVFSILLIFLLAILVFSTYLATDSKHWPTTKGKIVSVQIIKKKTGSSSVVYSQPVISYEYFVGGKQFKSVRLDSRLVAYDKEAESEVVVALYPEGSQVDVFYHPIFNSIACLRVGFFGKWVYATLYFFCLLPLGSIFLHNFVF